MVDPGFESKGVVANSINAGYVLILEWLNKGDLRTGAALRDRLRRRGVPVEYVRCHHSEEVRAALECAVRDVSRRGAPIVHIESHGVDPHAIDSSQSAFGAGTDCVRWATFGHWLAALNAASDFNILLVGAACWGASAAYAFRVDQSVPFMGCIGFKTSIREASLRDAMLELHRSLLVDGNVARAVSSAQLELHDASEKLAFISVTQLARMTVAGLCRKTMDLGAIAALADLREEDLIDHPELRELLELYVRRATVEIWDKWFPPRVQARSPAYRLEWPTIVRD
jgi:hypothetical protein